LTAFTDYRFSAAQGDHVSLDEYCAYLERYATHFNLWDDIKTKSRVVGVEKVDGSHRVTVQRQGEDGEFIRHRRKSEVLKSFLSRNENLYFTLFDHLHRSTLHRSSPRYPRNRSLQDATRKDSDSLIRTQETRFTQREEGFDPRNRRNWYGSRL